MFHLAGEPWREFADSDGIYAKYVQAFNEILELSNITGKRVGVEDGSRLIREA